MYPTNSLLLNSGVFAPFVVKDDLDWAKDYSSHATLA